MKNIKQLLLLGAFGLFISTSCQQHKTTSENASNNPDSIIKAQLDQKLDTAWTDVGDSLIVPDVAFQLEYSEKAKKLLRETQESVIVGTFFLGVPSDTNSTAYKHDGQINLASKDTELTKENFVVIRGLKIAKSDLKLLKDKDFDVSVNVYSGRRSNPNNVLSGGFFDMPISAARGKTHTIKLELIEEAHPIN